MSHLTDRLARLDIDFPEPPDIGLALARIGRRRSFPVVRWAVAFGIALFAIGVGPARDAVADWLGLGVVRVVEADVVPSDLELTVGDLGDPIVVSDAGPWPTLLGRPDAAFVAEEPPAESFVWVARPGLGSLGDSGIGAIFTRFGGAPAQPAVQKTATQGTSIGNVRVNGAPGYWISGEAHAFAYVDSDGQVILESLRLAGDTLLWEVDGVTYRLESSLPLEWAIAVAESL